MNRLRQLTEQLKGSLCEGHGDFMDREIQEGHSLVARGLDTWLDVIEKLERRPEGKGAAKQLHELTYKIGDLAAKVHGLKLPKK